MFAKLRGAKFSTPTKGNPQEEEEQQLYPNSKNHSQDTPNSAGSNETNPNQGTNSTLAEEDDDPEDEKKVDEGAPPPSPTADTKSTETSPSLGDLFEEGRQMFQQTWFALFEEACISSPCSNGESAMDDTTTLKRIDEEQEAVPDPEVLGISRLTPPDKENEGNASTRETKPGKDPRMARGSAPQSSTTSKGAAAAGAIEVSAKNKVKVIDAAPKPPLDKKEKSGVKASPGQDSIKKHAPFELLEVTSAEAVELERSISELTMRSSYGGVEHLQRLPDNRRMAYYAVGKHHRQSGRGGNRRCYFSGKLILGGAPFYAGTVQQGLRTLVVFCLPSAVGLPDKDTMDSLKREQKRRQAPVPANLAVQKQQSGSTQGGASYVMRDTSLSTKSLEKRASKGSSKRRQSGLSSHADGTASITSKSISRLSSLDDLSLSIEGDLDPNWGLDRDLLVQVLPEADGALLTEMSNLYPEQFATLPVQVRASARWNLYVKFCFFSGLPIAEGEMHYKVKDDIADQVYGEELDFSHDVMEAVNGEQSAEILQLPNQKVFRYLRKHYAQQCSKLDDRVFRRTAWERVAPEI
jgi:hypothetical protein